MFIVPLLHSHGSSIRQFTLKYYNLLVFHLCALVFQWLSVPVYLSSERFHAVSWCGRVALVPPAGPVCCASALLASCGPLFFHQSLRGPCCCQGWNEIEISLSCWQEEMAISATPVTSTEWWWGACKALFFSSHQRSIRFHMDWSFDVNWANVS